jgi:fucose permease
MDHLAGLFRSSAEARPAVLHPRLRHLAERLLIPFLKIVCGLNNFQALWVTFAFYIAYTVMALPSAAVLKRTGYKKGMTLGLG